MMLPILIVEGYSQPAVKTHTSSALPKLSDWVNDYEGILNQSEQGEFTRLMIAHAKKTGDQIVMVTIDSISPYTDIATFTTDLANREGIGQKGKDNGVLIVFSQKLRLVRIGVGLGLENRLTDSLCSQIIQESMLPRFRDGAYASGLSEGLKSIIYMLERPSNQIEVRVEPSKKER
jgi:uncharacterized protein